MITEKNISYYKILDEKIKVDKEKAYSLFHPSHIRQSKGKINEKQYWQEIFKKLGRKFDPTCIGLQYKAKENTYKVNKKMLNLADKLKKKGYVVAMLSNSIEPHARIYEKVGVYKHFDPCMLSHEIGMIKPNKNIFLYMFKKLGLKANECVFIDDLKKNWIAAKKVGLPLVKFENYNGCVKDLKKLGVKF